MNAKWTTIALAGTLTIALVGCGSATEEEAAPTDLGQISIGGKADDPIMAFDIDVPPGEDKRFEFSMSGDLIASVHQDDEGAGLTTLSIWDPNAFEGAVELVYYDEFGTEVSEPTPSTSPYVRARDVEGHPIMIRRYMVTIRNVDEENPTRGKLLLSQPEPTDCTSFARPDRTFDPIARCKVVIDGKLEGESGFAVKWVDACVGTGQRTDPSSAETASTIAVLGRYGYGKPDSDYVTSNSRLKHFARVDSWNEDEVTADYNTTHAITREKTRLMGPETEREVREFLYMYHYDLNENTLEYRVKSRPLIWPNWYWELGATFACEPIETL